MLRCLLAAGALFFAFSAHASLLISPVKIVMQDRVGQVSLTNQSDTETTVQLIPFAWEVREGEDVVTPLTGADRSKIVVTPPVVKLMPGQTQIVRVMTRVPASENQFFRLGIVQPAKLGESRIMTMDRLPVFPYAGKGQPKLRFSHILYGDSWYISLHNTGSRYERINAWFYGDRRDVDDGAQIHRTKVDVLTGSTRILQIPYDPDATRVTLVGENATVYSIELD